MIVRCGQALVAVTSVVGASIIAVQYRAEDQTADGSNRDSLCDLAAVAGRRRRRRRIALSIARVYGWLIFGLQLTNALLSVRIAQNNIAILLYNDALSCVRTGIASGLID